MIFEIYEGYTEDGQGYRRYAIRPEEFEDEEYQKEYGEKQKPENWFEPRFCHNVTKLGEIEVEGDVDLLYNSFSIDGD